MHSVKTILISLAFLLITNAAYARAMKLSEAEAEITKRSYIIHVNADGSYNMRDERLLKMKGLQAIDELGTYQKTYPSADAYEIKAVTASTINGNNKIDVPESSIHITRPGGSTSGFDEDQKLTIAFPAVKKDSTLSFVIETKMTKPPIPGHFDFSKYFGTGLPIKKARVEIHSEKKLFYGVFFDLASFTITEKENIGAKKYKYTYIAENNKTLFYDVIFENSRRLAAISQREAYLRFSLTKNYGEMAQGIIDSYENILSGNLPKLYQDLIKKAKNANSIADQTDIITSELSKTHRYMGDWRTVKGGHIPRKLSSCSYRPQLTLPCWFI